MNKKKTRLQASLQNYVDRTRQQSQEAARLLDRDVTLGFHYLVQNCVSIGDVPLEMVRERAAILDRLPLAAVAEMKRLHTALVAAYTGKEAALDRVESDMIQAGANREVLAAFYDVPYGGFGHDYGDGGDLSIVAEVIASLMDMVFRVSSEEQTYCGVLELMREWYTPMEAAKPEDDAATISAIVDMTR